MSTEILEKPNAEVVTENAIQFEQTDEYNQELQETNPEDSVMETGIVLNRHIYDMYQSNKGLKLAIVTAKIKDLYQDGFPEDVNEKGVQSAITRLVHQVKKLRKSLNRQKGIIRYNELLDEEFLLPRRTTQKKRKPAHLLETSELLMPAERKREPPKRYVEPDHNDPKIRKPYWICVGNKQILRWKSLKQKSGHKWNSDFAAFLMDRYEAYDELHKTCENLKLIQHELNDERQNLLKITQYTKNYFESLSKMRLSGTLCDLIIHTSDNQTLLAHSVVMAAISPVLKTYIMSNQQDGKAVEYFSNNITCTAWNTILNFAYHRESIIFSFVNDIQYAIDSLQINFQSKYRTRQNNRRAISLIAGKAVDGSMCPETHALKAVTKPNDTAGCALDKQLFRHKGNVLHKSSTQENNFSTDVVKQEPMSLDRDSFTHTSTNDIVFLRSFGNTNVINETTFKQSTNQQLVDIKRDSSNDPNDMLSHRTLQNESHLPRADVKQESMSPNGHQFEFTASKENTLQLSPGNLNETASNDHSFTQNLVDIEQCSPNDPNDVLPNRTKQNENNPSNEEIKQEPGENSHHPFEITASTDNASCFGPGKTIRINETSSKTNSASQNLVAAIDSSFARSDNYVQPVVIVPETQTNLTDQMEFSSSAFQYDEDIHSETSHCSVLCSDHDTFKTLQSPKVTHTDKIGNSTYHSDDSQDIDNEGV